jgi:protein-tyrosine kinase
VRREEPTLIPVAENSPLTARHIGSLLVAAGKITRDDCERILRHSKGTGERFGDAAINLGLVSREEIERTIAQQFSYPYLVPGTSSISRAVVAAFAPFTRRAEPIRAIRTQLLLRWFDAEPNKKELAVVSCDRRDGRSYLTANLAVAFAQQGKRTLLIDADLRTPQQHVLFGLSNRTGLSSLLSDRGDADCVKATPGFASLRVLTSGPVPPNPQELLNRIKFNQLIQDYRNQFDVILFDTSAGSWGADSQVVAASAEGALMLTCVHKSRMAHMKSLCEGMSAAGTALVGFVMNKR